MTITMVKTKDFALQLKSIDEAGTIEGYASVFGNRDSHNEIVDPGAFSDSLARHKREGTFPLMLWQHNSDEPIGVWDDLADDGKGLRALGKLLKGVQVAEEAHIRLKAGAVRGMSIGFRVMQGGVAEDEKNPGVFHLTKLDLMEVSIVSFPSNRRARVDTVKSELVGRLEDFARKVRDGEPPAIKEFEDILREAGVPRAMATQIASVGYARAIRSESEGGEATISAVQDAIASLRSIPAK